MTNSTAILLELSDMYMTDSISPHNTKGLRNRELWLLQGAGIYDWHQAKAALNANTLKDIKGIGKKTIEAISNANPLVSQLRNT